MRLASIDRPLHAGEQLYVPEDMFLQADVQMAIKSELLIVVAGEDKVLAGRKGYNIPDDIIKIKCANKLNQTLSISDPKISLKPKEIFYVTKADFVKTDLQNALEMGAVEILDKTIKKKKYNFKDKKEENVILVENKVEEVKEYEDGSREDRIQKALILNTVLKDSNQNEIIKEVKISTKKFPAGPTAHYVNPNNDEALITEQNSEVHFVDAPKEKREDVVLKPAPKKRNSPRFVKKSNKEEDHST